MLLPNKLFSYNESVLSKLPLLLNILDGSKTPRELFHLTGLSPLVLLDALDCLYALGKIDINDEGKIYLC